MADMQDKRPAVVDIIKNGAECKPKLGNRVYEIAATSDQQLGESYAVVRLGGFNREWLDSEQSEYQTYRVVVWLFAKGMTDFKNIEMAIVDDMHAAGWELDSPSMSQEDYSQKDGVFYYAKWLMFVFQEVF